MTDHAIRTVVIVGGGVAGWLAAATLARVLNRDRTRITLVETGDIDPIEAQGATVPALAGLHRLIGLHEDALMAACAGTFRLGTDFVDWGAVGRRYFHPLGQIGQDIGGVHFHQLWLRERTRHAIPDVAAWSMGAAAAARGRFARAAPDDRSALRDLTYALHLDPVRYADHLRDHAGRLGAERVRGAIAGVELHPVNGHVRAVRLGDGRLVEGDLFLDCSGPRALLIGEALATGHESYAAWLPCDRMVSVASALPDPREPAPYSRATAGPAGWRWHVPLRCQAVNGLVYASAHLDDAGAEAALLATLDGAPLGDARRHSYRPGRRHEQWARNVVALGSAAGAIEPLEGTGTYLVQASIERLVALFPDRRFNPVERAAFNRHMRERHEDVRDVTILHYAASRRDDTPFWRQVRAMTLPDTLRRRLDLWKGKGRVFRDEGELFGVSAWAAVCLGQDLQPSHWEPAVDALDADKIGGALQGIARDYAAAAERLPTHGEALRAIAPTSASPSTGTGAAGGSPPFAFAAMPFDPGRDRGPLL